MAFLILAEGLRGRGLEEPETVCWESSREWVPGSPSWDWETPRLCPHRNQSSSDLSLDLTLTSCFRRGSCLPVVRDRRWQAPITSGIQALVIALHYFFLRSPPGLGIL